MYTKDFRKKDLQMLLMDGNMWNKLRVIQDNFSYKSRWSLHHQLIFKDLEDEKIYSTQYARGATEQQDEQPFQYDADEITCVEVIPEEIKTIAYVVKPLSEEDAAKKPKKKAKKELDYTDQAAHYARPLLGGFGGGGMGGGIGTAQQTRQQVTAGGGRNVGRTNQWVVVDDPARPLQPGEFRTIYGAVDTAVQQDAPRGLAQTAPVHRDGMELNAIPHPMPEPTMTVAERAARDLNNWMREELAGFAETETDTEF